MGVLPLKIILVACATIWLLICMLLYRGTRNAAWLAGTTVASCLFFLGVTVLASMLVPEALFLAPLWLGVLVLSVLHLQAAQRHPTQIWPIAGGIPNHQTTRVPPIIGGGRDAYI
jgi:hypothetical protein